MPIHPKYDNSDQMWSGLPMLDPQVIKSTNRLRVPKEQSLHLKLLKVQLRQQELATYASKLQGEVAAVEAQKFHLGQVAPNVQPAVAVDPVSIEFCFK